MDSRIMKYWDNGKICVEDKIKTGEYPFKTNLPTFHYSIIQCLRQKFKPQKNIVYFHLFVKIPSNFSISFGVCNDHREPNP